MSNGFAGGVELGEEMGEHRGSPSLREVEHRLPLSVARFEEEGLDPVVSRRCARMLTEKRGGGAASGWI